MNLSKPDQINLIIAHRISQMIGHKITPQTIEKLKLAISQRMKILGMNDINFYSSLILTAKPKLTEELAALIELLINTESYFFRDKNLFKLLTSKLLPELIHKNMHKKTLRIWSAGCSSGEEAYSIAISLLQSLPNWKQWNIKILGTDISKKMIQFAKRAEYGKNSFRLMSSMELSHYFIKTEDQLTVDPILKELVTFDHLNLLSDFTLDANYLNSDLIICRNVFIYLKNQAIEKVLKQFSKVLSTDGILICGHGELIGVEHDLQMEWIDQSVLFKKRREV